MPPCPGVPGRAAVFSQVTLCGGSGAGGRRRVESPDREGYPQCERIAGDEWRKAGDLAHTAQPVADGVRMDEQGSRRTLEYAAGREERVQRLQQLAAGPGQRRVDLV